MSESSTTLNASASKDAVVERCVQFFSLDKINAAIDKFEKSLSQRLSKRNKSDNLQVQLVTDLYDKMWLLDSNSTPLPTFVAADFSRVPQDKKEVGNNNDSLASTEQLLASILSLKSIVRDLQSKMVTSRLLTLHLPNFAAILHLHHHFRRLPPRQMGQDQRRRSVQGSLGLTESLGRLRRFFPNPKVIQRRKLPM